MNKTEFLGGLAEKLSEDLSPDAVEEQVNYYRGYIDGELSKGRSEEDITFDLGDPILIARNIVESPQSYRVNTTSSYEQGMTESEYKDTRGLAGEEMPEDHVPENANSYAETAQSYAETVNNGNSGNYKEAERNRAAFDNGFFESGQKQTVERGGFTSIFRRLDGGINWKLISIILIILLIIVAVLAIAAKIVVTFWPVFLIMLIVSLIFSKKDRYR